MATEPDELYTLRAQFWLGHYGLCLEEGKQAVRRPMPPHLKAEREEVMLRAMIALGEYDRVVTEANAGDKSPAIQALGLHASYLAASDADTRQGIVDRMKVLLADGGSSDTSVQLTACHVFLHADLLKEALSCVHLGLTMEHLAMGLQIYIKIDRIDLAADALGLLKQADEDSILAQLCSAYISISKGRSESNDAVHVLSGLSEQYGPSVMILNCLAVANMVGGKYEAAESNLKEALAEGGENDADALVNVVVCMQHLGKSSSAIEPYLTKLRAGHADHPFVKGLARVEGAFEREGGKYEIKS